MKNKTKSLIKRISCLVAVFVLVALSVIPCFAETVSVENYKTYPNTICDGGMIVTVTSRDDTDFAVDDVGGIKYQVIPSSAFGSYAVQYCFSNHVGNFELVYSLLSDNRASTRLDQTLKMGDLCYIREIFREYKTGSFFLDGGSDIEFRIYYYDEVVGIDISEFIGVFDIGIDMQYHLLGDEQIFEKSLWLNDEQELYNFGITDLYNLSGLNYGTPIVVDYLKFTISRDDYTLYTVKKVTTGLEIIYDSSMIFGLEGDTGENEGDTGENEGDTGENEGDTGENEGGDYIGIPDYLFRDYSSWIATAIGGFMDFEIVPHFSLGGILCVTIALSLVLMWLRLFGGG